MQLPSLDFSPLRGALQASQGAQTAALLPEGQQIQKELRALQRSDIDLNRQATLIGRKVEDRNAIFGTIENAVDVGTRIYGIIEQGQMEKAKGQILEMSRSLEAQAQKDIYNGSFQTVTDDQGMVSFKMSDEYSALSDQYRAKLTESFGGMPNVERFAQTAFGTKEAEVSSWAIGQKYSAATKERDELAAQNLSDAIQTARRTGDLAVVAGAVSSRTWNTPEQRAAILKIAEQDVADFRVSDQAQAVAVSQGYASGLEYLEKNSGQMSDLKKEQARVDLGRQEERLQTATSQKFSEAMLAGLKDGKTPASVMAELRKAPGIPEGRKAQAIEAAQTAQVAAATDRGLEVYNKARDKDLAGLKADRERIQSGNLAYLYEGVPETKKAILDLFDREIAALTPDEPSKTDSQEQYDRLMEATLQQYKDRVIDFAGAMSNAKKYSQFCSPSKIGTIMNALRDEVPLEFQDQFNSLAKVAESSYLKMVGAEKADELTPEQIGEMASLKGFLMGSALDMVQESKRDGMNAKIFGERINAVVGSYLSKEYDFLRKGIQVKGGFLFGVGKKTAEQSAAEFQHNITANPTLADSLVFQDANGKVRYAPGAEEKLSALWDQQERMILKGTTATKLTRAPTVEGNDITVSMTYRDEKGRIYRVMSPDGSTNRIQYKTANGWETLR